MGKIEILSLNSSGCAQRRNKEVEMVILGWRCEKTDVGNTVVKGTIKQDEGNGYLSSGTMSKTFSFSTVG